MFTISKRFAFCASHQLDRMPANHKCRRLHGHNYTVDVELRVESLDACGMVRDYGDLGLFRDYLREQLDHRHLNDVFPVPTAEIVAAGLYAAAVAMFPEVVAVRVSETPETWAEFRP